MPVSNFLSLHLHVHYTFYTILYRECYSLMNTVLHLAQFSFHYSFWLITSHQSIDLQKPRTQNAVLYGDIIYATAAAPVWEQNCWFVSSCLTKSTFILYLRAFIQLQHSVPPHSSLKVSLLSKGRSQEKKKK